MRAIKIAIYLGVMLTTQGASAFSSTYEAIRGLEGSWIAEGEGGEEEKQLRYEVVAGGHTVLEYVYGMVTAYHLDGDRVMATHYCEADNQPRMIAPLALTEEGVVYFTFLDLTGNSREGYISSVGFKFEASDRIVQTWSWQDQSGTQSFSKTFTRQK